MAVFPLGILKPFYPSPQVRHPKRVGLRIGYKTDCTASSKLAFLSIEHLPAILWGKYYVVLALPFCMR